MLKAYEDSILEEFSNMSILPSTPQQKTSRKKMSLATKSPVDDGYFNGDSDEEDSMSKAIDEGIDILNAVKSLKKSSNWSCRF